MTCCCWGVFNARRIWWAESSAAEGTMRITRWADAAIDMKVTGPVLLLVVVVTVCAVPCSTKLSD